MEHFLGPFVEMGFSQCCFGQWGLETDNSFFAGRPAALCAVLTVSRLSNVES